MGVSSKDSKEALRCLKALASGNGARCIFVREARGFRFIGATHISWKFKLIESWGFDSEGLHPRYPGC
jgi:hypothetical protein